jgi:drug/metabolite transporter (DMT)-like permease
MENNNTKWYLLAFLGCVWGSSFILMQLGLKGVNSVQMGSLRIVFAGLFLIVIGFKEIPKIPLYKWKYIALTSLFGTFLPVYLFALALSKIDGSVSSILNSLTPLNTLVVGLLFFGTSVQRRQVFGVIIGFLGCLLLVLFDDGDNTTENYYYALLILLASLFYGVNVNLIKKYLSDLRPITISTGNFIIMFIPALVVLYFSDFFEIASQEKVITSLGYIAILGIIGTGLSNILFFKLIQLSSPVFAASVTYIIPVVAIFLGYFFMKESLNFLQIIGASIVLLGVYFSSRK